jgi:hypothetical protein
MTETPDLTMYHRIHAAMTSSGERLHAAVCCLRPGERRRAGALAKWFAGFGGELRAHHVVEDEIFFPALADRLDGFGDDEAKLAADHAELDHLIDTMGVALRRLADPRLGWVSVQEEAERVAEELSDHLRAHLAYENDEILPLFEPHLTAAEYDALDQQAIKHMSVRQLVFTIPWLAATLDEEARAEVLAEAPKPLVLLWRASRRRYAKLEAFALGTPRKARTGVH